MKILIVDDDAAVLNSLKRFLTAYDHEIQTASNGSEAMRMIEDDLEIEVILTDVNCSSRSNSGDDGIWFAEKFSQIFSERSRKVPLFFMTEELMEGQGEKIKAISPNPIIQKNTSWTEIIKTLETAVQGAKQPAQHQTAVA